MYKYSITLGDWSGDGHSMTEMYIVSSNKTNEEILAAYDKACQIVGFRFSDICQNYEDNKLPKHMIEAMEQKLGMDFTKYEDLEIDDGETYLDSDTYLKILLDFIMTQDPEMKLKIDFIDPLYLGRKSFGYGLFFN